MSGLYVAVLCILFLFLGFALGGEYVLWLGGKVWESDDRRP
jgi:hypothetical protein